MQILIDNSVWVAYFEACLQGHSNINVTDAQESISSQPGQSSALTHSPSIVETNLIDAHHNDADSLLIETIEFLIDENFIVTNEVVLAELTPYLRTRCIPKSPTNKTSIISSVLSNSADCSDVPALKEPILKMPLNINWEEIACFHTQCGQAQLESVNLTDLLLTQSALQNELIIFSFKPQFHALKHLLGVDILQYGRIK